VHDPNGNRWKDAEITKYIDIAQRRISVMSLCLEGSIDYIGDSSLGAYALPEDFLEFTGFTIPNGNPVCLQSFNTLDDYYTAKFLYSQTDQTPIGVCLDFGSWNEVRFYPSPTDGVAIGNLKYKRLSTDGIIEIDEKDALVNYSLFRMYIKQHDKQSVQKSILFYEKFAKRERELLVRRKTDYKRKIHGTFF
jgi:hypothetical protein